MDNLHCGNENCVDYDSLRFCNCKRADRKGSAAWVGTCKARQRYLEGELDKQPQEDDRDGPVVAAPGFKFSRDFWEESIYHYRNFEDVLNELSHGQINCLEIGTFEAKTAIWILENHPQADVTVIDPDPGPHFMHNRQVLNGMGMGRRFHWLKEYSITALIVDGMHCNAQGYDFIYIDGDHNACGVLEDAVLAWQILKVGGIMLFDDYMMEIRDPWFYIMHKEFQCRDGLTFHHPKEAIDAFLTIYKGQYEIIIDNYQIGIRKTCHLGAKNLEHGDNSQEAQYEQDG